MKLETNEPIEIYIYHELDMVIVTVDGIVYAVMHNVDSIDDIDLDDLRDWIENTYYDDCYKSEYYIPTDLNSNNFKK